MPSFHGDVAQLVERRNGIAEVDGSIPFVSTENRQGLRDVAGPFLYLGIRPER